MARILFATMPITGHVNPGLPIARKLVSRGHHVSWYTGSKFKSSIESTGSSFIAAGGRLDFDDSKIDEFFPKRKELKGLDQLKYDLKRIFTEHIPESVREIQALLKEFPADAIVVDTAFGTGPLLAHLGGPPCIAYGITAFPLASDEVAPFGLGLLPDSSPLGKVRNRMLKQLADKVLFKDVIDCRNQVRAQFNLAPDEGGLFDSVVLGSKLYLQGTVKELEYPRSNMPDHVHFIGPLLPDMSRHATTPDWWDEMVNSEIPVVHVSQGTIATDVGDLITPTIYALADMNVLVIVSSRCIPPSLMDELPSNVRTAEFLPYDQLMKHVDVFVTNGGYGGVHFALSEGVPLVVAGATEDKPEVANRIEWSGAGINLRTNKPNLHQIRRAVKRSIRQPIFRQKAQAIKEQIEKLDAAEEAARLIESVVSA